MDSKGKNIVDFGAARKNLRRKAKDQARADKEARAAENRIRFGRTGAQKKRDKLEEDRRRKLFDDTRRTEPNAPDADDIDGKDPRK